MRRLLLLALLAATPAHAQWNILDAPTTADLRGVSAPTPSIVWISGTHGTVLRSTDAGTHWLPCTTPPNADPLDFRGIQAFDANTAIVMSSGKGDLSRLYKTTDACKNWRLVLTNPDKDGFWDAIQLKRTQFNQNRPPAYIGTLVGDPVNGKFVEFETRDDGEHWSKIDGGEAGEPQSRQGESLFAASNSSMILTGNGSGKIFVTGGSSGARSFVLSEYVKHDPKVSWKYLGGNIPLAKADSAGAFSIALSAGDENIANTVADDKWTLLYFPKGICIAVGGDYKKPNESQGTAAFSLDSGLHWTVSTTPPHGYRSAVAYSAPTQTWITVGPNGTDISTDDGRNWHPLLPLPGEAPDAAQHWNALALPFVVGPHGRVGILNPAALQPTSAAK